MSLEYFVKLICSNKLKISIAESQPEINAFYFIYPVILLLGLALSLIIPNEWKKFYLFSSRNILNKIFAYNGNVVFTIFYLLISLTKLISLPIKKQFLGSLLPIPNTISIDDNKNKKSKKKVLFSQFLKFILKNIILFIDFFIIDHLFIATGGNCFINNLPTSDVKDAQVCNKMKGEWKGGFDISGHFCFITSISLMFLCELKMMIEEYQFKHVNKIMASLILIIVFIWCCLLSVTSVFYHTVLEKMLGLSMGYICPLIIYSKFFEKILV
ncbi:hypothetical protein QEN19_001587 [Hanseniaspora menglaensis]